MPRTREAWPALLVSAVAGAAVWALSPLLTGRAEPWDVDGPFYVVAPVLAGAAAGALVPRPLLAWSLVFALAAAVAAWLRGRVEAPR